MPKSKHRRKGRNRPRSAQAPASSVDPEPSGLFADAEPASALDDPADDPEMAAALALAEAELADELAAADDDGELGPYLGDPDEDGDFAAVAGPLLEAVALIGAVLIFELNEVMRSEREFDAIRYARNLANLPALPDLD
jgi:hypothetical protein